MIKTYRRSSADASGNEAGWREVWEGQVLSEKYLLSTAWDGYPEVFARYLTRPAFILEAGCGLGKYVIHLFRAGHRVIGVDLDRRALRRALQFKPGLPLGVADVVELPFGAGVFDAYVSLGVVEHFEAGPQLALHEARRVLRPGGLAFVAVPYQHLLKNLSLRLAPNDLHRRARGFEPEPEAGRARIFYQYAFTQREIVREIAAAGFQVLSAHPCSRLHWFLHRAPLRRLRNRLRPRAVLQERQDRDGWARGSLAATVGDPLRLVAPQGSVVEGERPGRVQDIARRLQRFIPGWLSGHMLLVVARRE